jgi:hypothetical protein
LENSVITRVRQRLGQPGTAAISPAQKVNFAGDRRKSRQIVAFSPYIE